MKTPETRMWYRLAVAPSAGPTRLVAAPGAHLGEAIRAAERHVSRGRVIAAATAGADAPLGEAVGKHQVVELGSSDEVAGLAWPRGVVPALGHGSALGAAQRGWTEHPDAARHIIEAQTDADHVVDLYLGLVERLPAADNLEIRVLDHFENAATTDVWLTSRINAKQVLRFLDDQDDDLIHNGHVELSIYLRAQGATLRLTEHKTVVWIAGDRALAPQVEAWLGELDVPRQGQLARISEASHFHYRLAGTRDRTKLGELLFRQRLRRVDKVASSPDAPQPS